MVNDNFFHCAGLLRRLIMVEIKKYKIKSRKSMRLGMFEGESSFGRNEGSGVVVGRSKQFTLIPRYE